jgi:cytochrome c55X
MKRTGAPQWWLSAVILAVGMVSKAGAGGASVDTARLSNLVRQDCGSCHGLTLKGGLGKPLTVEHLRQWDRDQIMHIILDGVPGTPMPPWRPLLSEIEAAWIADALRKGALQ